MSSPEEVIMIYPELFVGIDISKLKHDFAVFNEHKKMVHRPFVVRESREGYQYLLDRLDRLRQKYGTRKFYFGMEATGDYWKNLYFFLKKQSPDFALTVINPIRTRAFAKAELRRAKTDPVNAKDIGLFMAEKRPEPFVARPAIFDHIKDIDRHLYALKKQQTMAHNRLRIELGKVAPEIEQATPALAGKQLFALLQAYPTAEAIACATIQELQAIRYGKKDWPLSVKFITRMKTLAQDSIAHKTGNGAGLVVKSLIRQILTLQEEIESLKEQMTELFQHVRGQQSLLATIKGITKETAIVLEAYIGDVNRFGNAKKIVAYFGMNPTVSLSGKSKKRAAYLEKKGSGIVRHKLFMAVLSIIRHKQGQVYAYYARLVASGKPKLVAITAAMRKLLVIIYKMLKNQIPYDGNKK
jgi:transposase